MKTYCIQHDWLFFDDELAYPEPEEKTVNNDFNLQKAVPVKLSLFLSNDGEKYFNYFSKMGRRILLLDDVDNSDNPVIMSYKKLLIRALILRFRKNGVSCMAR